MFGHNATKAKITFSIDSSLVI